MVQSLRIMVLAILLLAPVAAAAGGKFGGAVSFDGTAGTGITIPSSASLQPTTGITLSAWVYPYATYTDWRPVITKGSDYWLYASNSVADGRCSVSGPMGNIGTSPGPVACAKANLTPNEWSYLAYTYDQASGLASLYVNGALAEQKSGLTEAIPVSGDPVQIGADSFGDLLFNGLIDQVRIYTYALPLNNGTGDVCSDAVLSVTRDMNCPIDPAITVAAPSTNGRYITSGSTVTISGTAACPDAIQNVAWINNRGFSGQAVGTASWSITNASLVQNRVNEFTVTVFCASGSATSTLLVRANGTYPVPVVLLAMDEGAGATANDTSGFKNNASFAGTGNTWAALAQYGPGIILNGSGYLTIAQADNLDLSIFTVEIWVNPAAPTAAERGLISKTGWPYWLWSSTTASGYCGTSSVLIGIEDNSGGFPVACDPNPLAPNTWVHLAATYDGAQLKLYRNAVLVATNDQIDLPLEHSGPLYIGTDPNTARTFAGIIDEVRVYNGALPLTNGTGDACTDALPSIIRDMACRITAVPIVAVWKVYPDAASKWYPDASLRLKP